MLAVLVPLIMTLVVGLGLVYSYRAMATARANGNIVRQIRSTITDLNHIVFSYVSYHEERPKQQFPAAYDSLTGLTAKIHLRDPEEQRLLQDIRLNSQSMQDLFVKLASIKDAGVAGSDKAFEEAEEQLVGQLLTRSRRADSSAALLRDLTDNDIGNAQKRGIALALSVLILTTVPLTLLLFRTRRSITTSLVRLRKGTEVIGSGNLEHRLAMSQNDELGELARSFDNMTEQLLTVTVSKERLQQEIEERRRVEEELREHREWLRVALTSIGDAVIATDVTGRITFMNLVAEEITGWALPEASMKPSTEIFNIINEYSRNEVESPVTRVLREGMVVGLANHTILVRKDGTEVPIDDSGAPIRDSGSKTIGVVLVFRDITERKHAEEALKHAHDELEQRVEERTVQLSQAYEALQREAEERRKTEEQLRQAQKMEAVGTLAGGIAHDFNNMLAVILGNSELALDDLDGIDGPKHNIEQIVKASKRARDLVKQILTFSRKTETGKKPIELTSLVKETSKLLRSALPSTLRIDLKVRAETDTIAADPVQIQQVVMNLAMNAAYAMRENGGVLTVRLTNISIEKDNEPDSSLPAGRYVKLRVRDTGTGMTQEVMDKIFDPFFTTKEAGQGTGMGLAVVYGIVKNHGGAVKVESKPGKGATFDIFLPCDIAEAKEQQEEEWTVPHGNERILLVDDEQSILEAASSILKRLGYRVTTALSASQAWNIFEKEQDSFDLVITDQTMPDFTGLDLAKRMLNAREDLPVILFTGYSETVSPEKARAAGINAFAMKPVARKELAQTVRQVLDKE
jgi:PAS domain S-box-containing protein